MDFDLQNSKPAQLSGSNIIGILPGKYWSTKKDRPIIIGAHWDTVLNSTGFNDNGSGVAILLEVARILGGATNCFQPDYTLFFFGLMPKCSRPIKFTDLKTENLPHPGIEASLLRSI